MQKIWILAVAGSMAASAAAADDYTNGYYRKDGTYVQGYHHTNPDGNPYNNYSTRGNTNPYTGQPGTKNPYETSDPYDNHRQDNQNSGWPR